MGVGFAKDAEANQRNNARLKNSFQEKYFKNQKYKIKKSHGLNLKPASEEELLRVRLKIEKQEKRNLWISIIIWTLALGTLAYFFLF